MSAQHTPGPWTNHGRQPNVPGLPHAAVAAKTLIARVYSEAYGDEEQEKANADLIAASPDMLAALRVAREVITQDRTAFADCSTGPDNTMEPDDLAALVEYDEALWQIDAAIAKAEGRS